LLEGFGRAITTNDLAIRLEQLESQIKQMKALNGQGGK